ncbi:hypothetical protein K457DRAFT_141351 [Linnemannia elongata AG-77]|uniref:Uncharacterized protein n=1 Tax=Linnemannia elongata AG-77 TaxID=1314771 RepID=A0A197JL89_9FUNG|nr:hypothetical protein K457DRAFT_141351 [Linnemannia elongata AG-77]
MYGEDERTSWLYDNHPGSQQFHGARAEAQPVSDDQQNQPRHGLCEGQKSRKKLEVEQALRLAGSWH